MPFLDVRNLHTSFETAAGTVRAVNDVSFSLEKGRVYALLGESGPAEVLYEEPLHPYTQALLASVPSGDPNRRMTTAPLSGDPPSPINPPSGCHFRTRCPFVMDRCAEEVPELMESGGRMVACHLFSGGEQSQEDQINLAADGAEQ